MTYTRVTLWVLLYTALVYSQLVNIANYSFLSYSFKGQLSTNPIFEIVKYSRLPVLILVFFIVVEYLKNQPKFVTFSILNYDLILFNIWMYFGLINAIDVLNAFFYTFWQTSAFMCILAVIYKLRESKDFESGLFHVFKLVFWSNIMVIPLLMLNLPTLGSNLTYEMAFSSKTFYPYCLLSIMIALCGARIICNRSLFKIDSFVNSKKIELLFLLVLLFFAFVSARRTPFFIMIFLMLVYLYYSVGRQIWKRVFFIMFVGLVISFLVSSLISYIDQHRYELTVLNKINDLRELDEGLDQDPSYRERLEVWDSYFKISQMVPFVGTGAYNSTLYRIKQLNGRGRSGLSPHNLWIGILVEHGYIGLFIFLIVMLRSFWLVFSKNKLGRFIMYGLLLYIPILGINWNEYNLIPGQVFYWTTMLIILFPRFYV